MLGRFDSCNPRLPLIYVKLNHIVTNTFDFKKAPILIGFYGAILGVALLLFGFENDKKMGPYAVHTVVGLSAVVWLFQTETIDKIVSRKKK